MYGDLVIAGIPLYSRYPEKNYHPVVMDWVRRVYLNGGYVSTKTIIAVNKFYKRIEAYGIADKMKSCCLFVPDNKIAAAVPIIHQPYLPYRLQEAETPPTKWGLYNQTLDRDKDIWYYPDLNSNMDLTIDGARTPEVLDPIVSIRTNFPQFQNNNLTFPNSNATGLPSFGLTLYSTSDETRYVPDTAGGDKNTLYYDNGVEEIDGPEGTLGITLCDNYNNTRIYCWNYEWVFPHEDYATQQGYFSFNRTSLSNLNLYYGSVNGFPTYNKGHSLLAADTNYIYDEMGLTPDDLHAYIPQQSAIYFNGINTLTNIYNRPRRLSFAAIHEGLTQSESTLLYNAIQYCRKELGGGFI